MPKVGEEVVLENRAGCKMLGKVERVYKSSRVAIIRELPGLPEYDNSSCDFAMALLKALRHG